MRKSKPSNKALDAAYEVIRETGDMDPGIEEALMRAHDPTLGLDRSVCLRDVVKLIRAEATGELLTDDYWDGVRFAATFIASEFGGIRHHD